MTPKPTTGEAVFRLAFLSRPRTAGHLALPPFAALYHFSACPYLRLSLALRPRLQS